MIETAVRAMERRKVELTVELDSRLREIFDGSRAERERYLGAAPSDGKRGTR